MQIRSFEDYIQAYQKSVREPEDFWAEIAAEFKWYRKWDSVLKWNFEGAEVRWFDGGQTNLCENCLDRHLQRSGDKPAIIWEANDPLEENRIITYSELHAMVSRFANVLKASGINKGDRVCIYMPMIPEAAVAMLACARVGAVHSVVFGGFSADSLSNRINDSGCKLLITSDGYFRGKKEVNLKEIADEALKNVKTIEKCIVYNNRNFTIEMKAGRDFWWNDEIKKVTAAHLPEMMNSEDPLFILYTSGSTGKPKGLLHTTGGYMVYAAYTFLNVFQYQENDIYWCTADIGWVTGHTYGVYGPLLNGATTLMFEGVPAFPDESRFWQVIDKHKINIFYTAPTAIRSLQSFGLKQFEGKKLDSLKVLGSVGEPINEEAWQWFYDNVGKKRCPIVDTWWQTETGGIMISPIAGITPTKPGFACLPLPGIQPVLMNEKGEELHGNDKEGNLCIKYPWPGMARTVYGDHERFRQTYFSTYPGYYFTGDGCRIDDEGFFRITGRVDDVINVSGHRIGTGELEDVINQHPSVIESAVVAFPHHIKGQGIYVYIICPDINGQNEQISSEIRNLVSEKIGAFAKPDKIQLVKGLPKTRSGKIMRRILRKIAENDTNSLGDTSTLLDPEVVEEIKKDAIALNSDHALN